MRLGQKNLVYSIVLAGIMLFLLLGYFICMLPYLYVDYVMDQNLGAIQEQHDSYVRRGSYEGIRVKNATACFSLEIPLKGERLLVSGKAFTAEILLRDQRLVQLLERAREMFSAETMDVEEMEELWKVLEEVFDSAGAGSGEFPLEVRLLYLRDMQGEFSNEWVQVHPWGDEKIVVEMSIEDFENQYTNYIALERREEGMVLSFLPVVTPQLDEIRPIVLQNLPMLGAVILLVVLLFSRAYSRGIVAPIVALARRAEQMKYGMLAQGPAAEEEMCPRGAAPEAGLHSQSSRDPRTQDELRELDKTLNEFYRQIQEGYRKLEEKNRELEEENRRQEVFMRSSSHQLKTPIAAALLLVEGMIQKVGRFQNTREYLPRVKEELLSMGKMVEDVLSLNQRPEDIKFWQTRVGKLLEEGIARCQVPILEKNLTVEFQGEKELEVCTDEALLSRILDNLLSNGVKYTPAGGRIRICLGEGQKGGMEVRIENSGARIPEDILPHIFEPFVSGSHGGPSGQRSHGLGLYIASYYAGRLGMKLSVCNSEEGVRAVLESGGGEI